jgi:hypothetical protein
MDLKKDVAYSLDTSETLYQFRALFAPKKRVEEGKVPLSEIQQLCVTLISDRADLAEEAISKEVGEDFVNLKWSDANRITRLS